MALRTTVSGEAVALITGGGSGIGRAVAVALSALGYHVVVVGRDAERLRETCAAAAGPCTAIDADLATGPGVQRVLTRVHREFRRLDVLVNNAGQAFHEPIDAVAAERVDALLLLNVGAVLKLTAGLAGLLTAASGAHIVNISSEQSLSPGPGRALYGGTKAAVNYVTRALAAELAGRGIRVNAVLPGAVDTAMLRAATGGTEVTTPLGPALDPREIADWVVHLVSSRPVTGALITVDGGTSLADP